MDNTRNCYFLLHFLGLIFVNWNFITGSTEPECREYVGPQPFLGLQPDLDPNLRGGAGGGIIVFGAAHEVRFKGLLTRWTLVTDAENGTFYLDVWRRQSDTSYKLVMSREVNVTTAGFQVIELKFGQRFVVQYADLFGMHFRFPNATVTQMANSTNNDPPCLAGNFEDMPAVGGILHTAGMAQAPHCQFALRAHISLYTHNPCGHLYYDSLSQLGDLRTERTISTYADTPGICSLKCLNEPSCISFTYKRELTEEGYRPDPFSNNGGVAIFASVHNKNKNKKKYNHCDLNCAIAEDELDNERLPDEANYTEYYHFH